MSAPAHPAPADLLRVLAGNTAGAAVRDAGGRRPLRAGRLSLDGGPAATPHRMAPFPLPGPGPYTAGAL